MKKLLSLCALVPTILFGQDVTETFNSTRIVNAHSTETLNKREWEYRIEHRFGDIGGQFGGVQTAFGFDQAADIRFAFEHGLTEKWMIGFARNKGVGRPYADSPQGYNSLLQGLTKYRILTQNKEKGMPISMAVLGEMYYTYMRPSTDPNVVTFFPKEIHRMSYASQMIIARKFSDKFSLAVLPTYVHRNYVAADDQNGIFSIGGALNYKWSKSMGVVMEYFYNIEPTGLRPWAENSVGIAYEYITNGHSFHINLTNARGFGAMQYVAFSQEDWLSGQFRLGFSIARTFKIRRRK